jgi:DNA-binding NarL/FixJ family response regulator
VLKATQRKLSGYLLKDAPFSEIKKCMQAVLKGEFYVSKVFHEFFNSEISPQIKK